MKASDIAYDVPTIVQWLSLLEFDGDICEDSFVMYPSYAHPRCQQRDRLNLPYEPAFRLDDISKQVLMRTMTLPAPLIQSIALFLPLPRLWKMRLDQIQSFYRKNPNAAIVYTLDIIDEILEDGDFLSACDQANIPAPKYHQSWHDWKRKAQSRIEWNDKDNQTTNSLMRHSTVTQQRSSTTITEMEPPTPRDERNPTIRALRRQVGYLSLLKRYQVHSPILNILMGKPYHMSFELIRQLMLLEDVASICRRCCCMDSLLVPQNDDNNVTLLSPIVHFQPHAALAIITLASDLSEWYYSERHVVGTT